MDTNENKPGSREVQRPDPSSLTTQMTYREISGLKELTYQEIRGLKELIESRLEAIEKGIEIAHQDLVRVPTDVQEQVGTLKQLHDVRISYEHELASLRFDHIRDRFAWTEQNRIEQKKDSADALAAALNAAKEAVAEQNKSNVAAITKSEANVTKGMDALASLIAQMGKSIDDKINDIKDRQTKSESNIFGRAAGGKDLMALIQIGILIAGFILGYFMLK